MAEGPAVFILTTVVAQAQILNRAVTPESERLMHPGIWLGHKGRRPAGINDFRSRWDIDEAKQGTYVCLQPGEGSQYLAKPGFEVAKILNIPELVTDTSLLLVEWQEFDP